MYLQILSNYISWQILWEFPLTKMSVWHMDFVKWSTYISIYFICASDAQTYWHCCLETYWHCSVSARLIDVAFTDLLALQPGTVTVTSERLMGLLQFHLQPWHTAFPVTRLSIAFDSCQGAIVSRLSWNWFRLVTHIRFLWTLGTTCPDLVTISDHFWKFVPGGDWTPVGRIFSL